MSFLKKTLKKFNPKDKDSVKTSPTESPISSPPSGGDGSGIARNGSVKDSPNGSVLPSVDERRKSQEVTHQEKLRRSMDKEHKKAEAKKRFTLARIESENFMREGPPDLTKLYRPYSMNMSKNRNHERRILFKEIDFQSKPASSWHMDHYLICYRIRRNSHYFSSAHTYSSSNECEAGFHRFPPTDYDYPGCIADVQTARSSDTRYVSPCESGPSTLTNNRRRTGWSSLGRRSGWYSLGTHGTKRRTVPQRDDCGGTRETTKGSEAGQECYSP